MSKETVEKLEKKSCTGCAACFNICPVDAIKMEYNEEGFLYPVIDEEKCILCGKCAKICPELNIDKKNKLFHEKGECYAMMAEDEIRKVSSSGGAFSLLAEYILEQNGCVCGASFADDFMSVKHVVVINRDNLGQLRGSKYLQSDIQESYRVLEEYLKQGKQVLFSGTPCQVSGFKMYLSKEYKNLLLVDIICHGVPSPKIYQKYVKEKSNGRKLVKTDFREKAYWGWGTATSLFFEDGSVYRGDCYTDEYWRGFLGGLETRACCGECQYANPQRVGDITLGDFWGVKEISQKLDDSKGTSLLLVNSKKGHEFLRVIQKNCLLLEKIELSKVLELGKTRNGQLLHPTKSHWARKRFFELVQTKSFVTSFEWARDNKFDVGITGWWYNENYGGTLTYYALHQVLKKMGFSVLMIGKCSDNPNYRPRYETIPYRFAMKHYHISKNYTHENISILNEHCKTFVSGSDQLFNPTLWEYSGPQYFLDYVSKKNNLVSYASSFGNGFVDNRNLRAKMSYWLHRFNAISVREDYGVDISREVFGIYAEKVMDPVFLCDVNEYCKLAESVQKKEKENYMLSFFLDPNEDKRNAILSISRKLGEKYINLLNAVDYERNAKLLNLDNTKPGIDVEEWLYYYMNSDFVITDSFHGTCFAIIFRKKFISIANKQRGERRFVSLLQEVGLLDRLIYDISDIDKKPELFNDIDYDSVYERISPKIKESYKWLENAIRNPAPQETDLFNTLNSEIERLKEEIKRLKINR